MFDDALCHPEIILAERARRIVHLRSAKGFDHGRRSAPVLDSRSQNRIGALTIGAEPKAVQIASEPLADQVHTRCERFWSGAVCDQDYLGGLRTALHHHLQVARETKMRN